jgi:hypothetical protein
MPDKYDLEIDRLMQGPIVELGHRCTEAWYAPPDNPTQVSPLFQYVTPSGRCEVRRDGLECGCLTEIHAREEADVEDPDDETLPPVKVAWLDSLTNEIQNDPDIPDRPGHIRSRKQLEKIADWQRRIDRELNRK